MNTRIRHWLYFLFLLFGSCSTKKNTFLSRNFHALRTEYNVMYNGNVALEKGKDYLLASYVDNYWEILPVERMQVEEEEAFSPSKEKNPHFEKAEEKAVKAIQKHSMNIDGKEYNPKMDEAYLLLGKARYFDQRFIPSQEAFNYILYKYWTGDKVNEAKIWREKVNIRLENEELALKNLQRMLKKEKLAPQDYADMHATMAQAYINLDRKNDAIQKLNIAAATTKNNEEKGRYYFIMGQLYRNLGVRDSSHYVFDKIIALHRKTPRVYVVNAELEKIRMFNEDTPADMQSLARIIMLEQDDENRVFLDKIYREKALFYAGTDSVHLMEVYLNKSLRTRTNDTYLKVFNYEDLAQLRFDNAQYEQAGLYYDSILVNLKRNSKKFRRIKKKRANLTDIITYEEITRNADSILHLVAMSDEQRQRYVENHIQKLKAKAKSNEGLVETQDQSLTTITKLDFPTIDNDQDAFYFYNPVTLQYGRNQFRVLWGNRKLEDNWRLADKSSAIALETVVLPSETKSRKEDRYDRAYYLNSIPSDPAVIDSMKMERNRAYYQLGILYKEKFREYPKAVETLEKLLKNNPEERLVLLANYHLYKSYEALKSPNADAVKQYIITRYPDSRYAAILKDPNKVIYDEKQPEIVYTSLFKTFENQEYETVITLAGQYISQFNGEAIVPKFEMLKAAAIGRLKGFEPYKEALHLIALNYPGDKEGKAAEKIWKEDLETLADKTFADTPIVSNWKLIYPVQRSDKKRIERVFNTISEALHDLKYDHLKVSKDVYNDTMLCVVVHGFKNKEYAMGYAELLRINKNYTMKDENFVISSYNYTIIQVHKNLDRYIEKKLNF